MAGDPAKPPVEVQVKVIKRLGAIVLVEHPRGDRCYLIICPSCGSDLSKVSFGSVMQTPMGLVPELWHPVRCPDCAAPLIPVRKPGVVLARHPLPSR